MKVSVLEKPVPSDKGGWGRGTRDARKRRSESRRRRGGCRVARARVLPAAFISQPHLSLDCPASPGPPCGSPWAPAGTSCCFKKQSWQEMVLGRTWCTGLGSEGACKRSITEWLGLDSACWVSGRSGWFAGNQCGQGEVLSSREKETPLHQKVEETRHQPGDPSSQLCLLDKFLSSCLFFFFK